MNKCVTWPPHAHIACIHTDWCSHFHSIHTQFTSKIAVVQLNVQHFETNHISTELAGQKKRWCYRAWGWADTARWCIAVKGDPLFFFFSPHSQNHGLHTHQPMPSPHFLTKVSEKRCSWNRDTRTANAQTTRIQNWKIQLSVVSPGSPLTFKVGQCHKTEISTYNHFRLSSSCKVWMFSL